MLYRRKNNKHENKICISNFNYLWGKHIFLNLKKNPSNEWFIINQRSLRIFNIIKKTLKIENLIISIDHRSSSLCGL